MSSDITDLFFDADKFIILLYEIIGCHIENYYMYIMTENAKYNRHRAVAPCVFSV